MAIKSSRILDYVRKHSDRPLKSKELAQALNIPQKDYTSFRKSVRQLLQSGELVRLKRNRIGLASKMNIAVGIISITRSGLGFVTDSETEPDIAIDAGSVHTAFYGDKVMVRLGGIRNDRRTGTVIKIVERAKRNIVGIFRVGRNFSYVEPDSRRLHRDLYIPSGSESGALDGEKVVAVLTEWDDPHLNPEGKVLERIGFPNDPGVDMITVIKEFNLPGDFDEELLAEAEEVAVMPDLSELGDREDFTADCVFTIDPADAKDHDDAVSVVAINGGYRLSVHIADVTHFVREGSLLEAEALLRGTSVYLPGMVIPMLPEILSNDVCSLKVNRRRLSLAVLIDFDRQGKMLSWRIAKGIIKSKAKLSYEDVQAFFDGEEVPDRVMRVADDLTVARKLARLLSRRRFAAGSLDFDLPEAKLVLDRHGEVIELGNRVRMESHRLVEEFMLVANQAVAKEIFRAGQILLYRVHDRPDMEKLESFSQFMSKLGHRFPVSPNMKPIQLAQFLKRMKSVPEVELINELMLRSMKKAVYQRENIGHFGLAFSHYTHYTSPIRRFPDLYIHRLLKHLKKGRYPVNFARQVDQRIDQVGSHCSDKERNSEAAERQAIKVKQVAYMARHVGDEFDGIISGVAGYGYFVRLNRLGVEGLVRISSLEDDYYHFDEKQFRLSGRRLGRTFRLGDKVRVAVLKVNRERNEIDLIPAGGEKSKSRSRKVKR